LDTAAYREEARHIIIRILVVDDYAAWRRFISSIVHKNSNWQIVGEAADGLEAVQKAEALQPDLILLDIGLPTLNGIAAARRIREISPGSKILFLSQESSVDAVQEALSLGAQGYVVKAHAGTELLPAMEAALQGQAFVGGGLSVHNFIYTGAQVLDQLGQERAFPSLMPRNRESTRSHAVEFHSDDASLLDGFTRFIETKLRAENAVIVIATESRRTSLLQKLQTDGQYIAAAMEQGRYIPLDVAETLSKFMVNGLPDPVRFAKASGELIESAGKAGKHTAVAACGECAPTLWAQGNADAAIQLEHLWDEVAEKYDVDLLCGYVLKSLQREQERHIYDRICAAHSTVLSQ
jgi:DNA-binding NarL/FixJ family response regulator